MSQRVNLITGSSGFIGRRLAAHLESRGETCVLVDRAHGFDLSIPGWSERLPDGAVDAVFHLAQSRRYREVPPAAADMTAVNVTATVELLDWSRRRGVQSFLLASTGTIYASSPAALTEDSPCANSSFYPATKRAAEILVEPYAAYFPIVVPRLFGVYGEGARRTLVADMIERVFTNKPITLAGGAGIYLTPLYVADCVATLAALVDGRVRRPFEIVNVAGDERLSLADMVADIGRCLGLAPNCTTTPDAPASLCADTSRLRSYYDADFTPFAAGIRRTLTADPPSTFCSRAAA